MQTAVVTDCKSAAARGININIMMKNYCLCLIVSLLVLMSCFDNRSIKITKEYIENDYWLNNEYKDRNEIAIAKLKIKDTYDTTMVNELEDYVYNYLLEVDTVDKSQNCWALIPKEIGNRVYFDKRYDSWRWVCNCSRLKLFENGDKKETIGELQNNSWYRFTYLRAQGVYDNYHFVYVFVDKEGKTHIFINNLSNV